MTKKYHSCDSVWSVQDVYEGGIQLGVSYIHKLRACPQSLQASFLPLVCRSLPYCIHDPAFGPVDPVLQVQEVKAELPAGVSESVGQTKHIESPLLLPRQAGLEKGWWKTENGRKYIPNKQFKCGQVN